MRRRLRLSLPFPSKLAKSPDWKRHPFLEAPTPAFEPSLPVEARKSTQLEASPLLEVPLPVKELPPSPCRSLQYAFSIPDLLERGVILFFFSFWDTGLERGRGPGSSPLISMARDVEVTPNPLSIMLRDGSTVILTKASTSNLEKDMAKQRDLSDYPPCEEGWSEEELSKLLHFSKVLGMPVEGHEVEILELLTKLKLRTGSNSLGDIRITKNPVELLGFDSS
ncbi:hypothetical protein CK203_091168 [Vitis vinifera]|uniref:Uncharacterized protein n=1 Tax=Vitis vinifera TaxID=29760 RepID=A0A438EYF6_VITVI|nr:hypothetical protein CK203_091168 [Vitis vinifera]